MARVHTKVEWEWVDGELVLVNDEFYEYEGEWAKAEFVVNGISGLLEIGGDAIEAVGDAAGEVLEFVGDVADSALDDPIGTIAKVAALMSGRPDLIPLIDGANTLAQGGDLDDALKAAAVSYVTQKVATTVGNYVGDAAGTAASAAEFDIPIGELGKSQAAMLASQEVGMNTLSATIHEIAGSAAGSAAAAIVTGQDPMEALLAGGASAGASALMGNEGGLANTPDSVKNVLSAATTAKLSGGNIEQAALSALIGSTQLAVDTINAMTEGYDYSDAEKALFADILSDTVSTAALGGDAGAALNARLSQVGSAALNEKISELGIENYIGQQIDVITGAYDEVSAKSDEIAIVYNDYEAVAAERGVVIEDVQRENEEYERLRELAQTAIDAQDGTQGKHDEAQAAVDTVNEFVEGFNERYETEYGPLIDGFDVELAELDTVYSALETEFLDLQEGLWGTVDDLDVRVLTPLREAVEMAYVGELAPDFDPEVYKIAAGLETDTSDADVRSHWLQYGQYTPNPVSEKQYTAHVQQNTTRILQEAADVAGVPLSHLSNEAITTITNALRDSFLTAADGTRYDVEGLSNATLVDLVDTGLQYSVDIDVDNPPVGATAVKADGVTDYDILTGAAVLTYHNPSKEFIWNKMDDYYVDYIDPETGEAWLGLLKTTIEATPPPTLEDMRSSDAPGYLDTLANLPSYALDAIGTTGSQVAEDIGNGVVEAAKNIKDYVDEAGDYGLQVGAGIALQAGGEILKAFNGLVTLAGESPDGTAMHDVANKMIAVGQATLPEEYITAIDGVKSVIGNATGIGGTLEAIYEGFQEAPTEFLIEYVGKEFLQEVVPLAIGGVAKLGVTGAMKAIKFADELASTIGTIAGLSAAKTTDIAESYGGAAASAYDDAYVTALNSGMSETEADTFAVDVAVRSGAVSATMTALLYDVGGGALEKALLGSTGGTASRALNEIASRLAQGTFVTVGEAGTNAIEEVAAQMVVEGALYQIDPTRDVSGNLAAAAAFGAIAGGGVSGGVYTTAQAVDVVSNVLSTANPYVASQINELRTNSPNAVGAAALATALTTVGITDPNIHLNLQNEVYDAGYTTRAEVFEAIQGSSELGQLGTEAYVPTEEEIASLVGENTIDEAIRQDAGYTDTAQDYLTQLQTNNAESDTDITATALEALGGVEGTEGTLYLHPETGELVTLSEMPATVTDHAVLGLLNTYLHKDITGDGHFRTMHDGFEAGDLNKDGALDLTDVLTLQKYHTGKEVDPEVVDRIQNALIPAIEDSVFASSQLTRDYDAVAQDGQLTEVGGSISNYLDSGDMENIDVAGAELQSSVDALIDPNYLNEDEVRDLYARNHIVFNANTEEISKFVGAHTAEDILPELQEYIDPRQLTMDEIRAVAEEENVTEEQLLDAFSFLSDGFVIQSTPEGIQSTIGILRSTIDPLATTRQEVIDKFAELGYADPTEEEIAQFITNEASEEDTLGAVTTHADERMLTAEEARVLFEDSYGYTPTDDELTQFVTQGSPSEVQGVINETMRDYADERTINKAEIASRLGELGWDNVPDSLIDTVVDDLFTDLAGDAAADNFQGTTEQVDAYLNNTLDQYVADRTTTEDDVRAAFETAGYTPTDEEIATFTRSSPHTDPSQILETAVPTYADTHQVTADEAREVMEAAGYEPTDAEVEAFVQEGRDVVATDILDNTVTDYVDTHQVTADEVEAMFADQNYTPEYGEIEAFIHQGADVDASAVLDTEIPEYVDPRQVTPEEAKNYYDSIGYVPTEEELAQVTGQYSEEDLADRSTGTMINTLSGDVGTVNENLGIVADDVSDISIRLGTPTIADDPNTIEDESAEATGVFADLSTLINQGNTLGEAIKTVSDNLGITEENLINHIDTSLANQNTTLTDYIDEVEKSLSEEIGEVGTALSEQIGTPAVADDLSTEIDESAPATGVYAGIDVLQEAGLSRDEAIATLADDLGTTAEALGTQIGDVETTLSTDIQAVGDLVGKPASEVTLTDMDFVADLLAQNEVINDLTPEQVQYDVTGDNAISQADLNLMLASFTDPNVAFAPTSKYAPTGVYGQVDRLGTDLSTQLGDVQTDLTTQLGDVQTDITTQLGDVQTDITTQMDQDLATTLDTITDTATETQQLAALGDMVGMMMQAPDATGQRVTVKAADPARIGYVYDFSDIFATPSQAGMFVTPYANGGLVQQTNDDLLRMLGER